MDKVAVLLLFVCFLGVCHGKCSLNATCHFNLTESSKTSNISVLLATNAEIDIKYLNNKDKTSNTTVCLSCNATTSGNGTNNSSRFELSWNKQNITYNMSFIFSKNTKKGDLTWTMDGMELTMNATFKDSKNGSKLFSANASTSSLIGRLDYTRSYQCKHNQKFKLTVRDVNNKTKILNYYNVTVYLSNFQVQAFEFSKNGTFGNAAQCTLDSSASKIVPIAVGSALGGLIVVVIVAYVIGRLRSKKQATYEALS